MRAVRPPPKVVPPGPPAHLFDPSEENATLDRERQLQRDMDRGRPPVGHSGDYLTPRGPPPGSVGLAHPVEPRGKIIDFDNDVEAEMRAIEDNIREILAGGLAPMQPKGAPASKLMSYSPSRAAPYDPKVSFSERDRDHYGGPSEPSPRSHPVNDYRGHEAPPHGYGPPPRGYDMPNPRYDAAPRGYDAPPPRDARPPDRPYRDVPVVTEPSRRGGEESGLGLGRNQRDEKDEKRRRQEEYKRQLDQQMGPPSGTKPRGGAIREPDPVGPSPARLRRDRELEGGPGGGLPIGGKMNDRDRKRQQQEEYRRQLEMDMAQQAGSRDRGKATKGRDRDLPGDPAGALVGGPVGIGIGMGGGPAGGRRQQQEDYRRQLDQDAQYGQPPRQRGHADIGPQPASARRGAAGPPPSIPASIIYPSDRDLRVPYSDERGPGPNPGAPGDTAEKDQRRHAQEAYRRQLDDDQHASHRDSDRDRLRYQDEGPRAPLAAGPPRSISVDPRAEEAARRRQAQEEYRRQLDRDQVGAPKDKPRGRHERREEEPSVTLPSAAAVAPAGPGRRAAPHVTEEVERRRRTQDEYKRQLDQQMAAKPAKELHHRRDPTVESSAYVPSNDQDHSFAKRSLDPRDPSPQAHPRSLYPAEPDIESEVYGEPGYPPRGYPDPGYASYPYPYAQPDAAEIRYRAELGPGPVQASGAPGGYHYGGAGEGYPNAEMRYADQAAAYHRDRRYEEDAARYAESSSRYEDEPPRAALGAASGGSTGPGLSPAKPARARLVTDIYGASDLLEQGKQTLDDKWRPSQIQNPQRSRNAMLEQKAALQKQLEENQARKKAEEEAEKRRQDKEDERIRRVMEEEERDKRIDREKKQALADAQAKDMADMQARKEREALTRKNRLHEDGTPSKGAAVSNPVATGASAGRQVLPVGPAGPESSPGYGRELDTNGPGGHRYVGQGGGYPHVAQASMEAASSPLRDLVGGAGPPPRSPHHLHNATAVDKFMTNYQARQAEATSGNEHHQMPPVGYGRDLRDSGDAYPRDPHGRDMYGGGRDPNPHPRDSYGRDPYARDPYARDPYARDPYARDPYARDPYARDPYMREPPPREAYGGGGRDSHPHGGDPYSRGSQDAYRRPDRDPYDLDARGGGGLPPRARFEEEGTNLSFVSESRLVPANPWSSSNLLSSIVQPGGGAARKASKGLHSEAMEKSLASDSLLVYHGQRTPAGNVFDHDRSMQPPPAKAPQPSPSGVVYNDQDSYSASQNRSRTASKAAPRLNPEALPPAGMATVAPSANPITSEGVQVTQQRRVIASTVAPTADDIPANRIFLNAQVDEARAPTPSDWSRDYRSGSLTPSEAAYAGRYSRPSSGAGTVSIPATGSATGRRTPAEPEPESITYAGLASRPTTATTRPLSGSMSSMSMAPSEPLPRRRNVLDANASVLQAQRVVPSSSAVDDAYTHRRRAHVLEADASLRPPSSESMAGGAGTAARAPVSDPGTAGGSSSRKWDVTPEQRQHTIQRLAQHSVANIMSPFQARDDDQSYGSYQNESFDAEQ